MRRTSHSHSLNGSGADIEAILASLLGGVHEGDVVIGRDNILTAIEQKMKVARAPNDVIEKTKEMIATKIDSTGEDPDKVTAIINEDGVTVVSISTKGGAFDLESLANALNFSDRHSGRSAFDDFGFGGFDGGMFARRRHHQEREERPDPMTQFVKSFGETTKAKKPKSGPSMAFSISVAASLAAHAMTRFPRNPANGAPNLASSFAQLITDLEIKDPVKFKNLTGYLEFYQMSLKTIVEQARQFAEHQGKDAAEELGRDLSYLCTVMLCISQDASDKAEKAKQEATNI